MRMIPDATIRKIVALCVMIIVIAFEQFIRMFQQNLDIIRIQTFGYYL